MLNRSLSKVSLLLLLLFTLTFTAKSQSGFHLSTEIDLLPGDDAVSPRLKVISRYPVSPQFSAGLGTGFTYYDDPLSLLPVFVNLKYKLMRTNLAPFVSLNTGYNISVLTDTHANIDNHHGGWMLDPAIGLQFTPKNGPGWYLSIGYNTDRSQFERQEGTNRTVKTDITYKRLKAGFGLSFSL